MDKEYIYIVQCTYFDENGHMFVLPLYATTNEEKALEKVIAKKSQLDRIDHLAELVAYSNKEVSMSRLHKACTILGSIASIKYIKVILNRDMDKNKTKTHKDNDNYLYELEKALTYQTPTHIIVPDYDTMERVHNVVSKYYGIPKYEDVLKDKNTNQIP